MWPKKENDDRRRRTHNIGWKQLFFGAGMPIFFLSFLVGCREQVHKVESWPGATRKHWFAVRKDNEEPIGSTT